MVHRTADMSTVSSALMRCADGGGQDEVLANTATRSCAAQDVKVPKPYT